MSAVRRELDALLLDEARARERGRAFRRGLLLLASAVIFAGFARQSSDGLIGYAAAAVLATVAVLVLTGRIDRHKEAPPSASAESGEGRIRSRGQTLVEFALVLPIFLLIVFGIFDGGRVVFAYNQLANDVRDVARWTSVKTWPPYCYTNPADPATRKSRAVCTQLIATNQMQMTPVTVESADCGACVINSPYRVTGRSDVTLSTPIVSSIIGPITLRASTEVPIE